MVYYMTQYKAVNLRFEYQQYRNLRDVAHALEISIPALIRRAVNEFVNKEFEGDNHDFRLREGTYAPDSNKNNDLTPLF